MSSMDAPTASTSTTVGIPSAKYLEMQKSWELVDDLLGGTRAMLAKGERWLPKFENEKDKAYGRRLKRSVLFNAYKDAIAGVVGRPFSREVSITGELDKRLERFRTRTDATGSSPTDFEKLLMEEGIHRGLVHVLIEHPQVELDDKGRAKGLTPDQIKEIGPYQALISAADMISWDETDLPNGDKGLEAIRFIERRDVLDADGQPQTVEFIRVVRSSGTWEDWRPAESVAGQRTWVLDSEGEHTYPGIPLETLYFNKTGFMTAEPVFEALAWMNLQHFQRESGLNNVLTILDCPALFGKGMDKDQEIHVGPSQATMAENPEADLKFVEHTGQAIGKSMDHIEKIEDRMERAGLRPLQQKVATATGESLREGRMTCDAQVWAIRQKHSLARRLRMAATWIKTTLKDDVEVYLFHDFEAVGPQAKEDMDQIQTMHQRGAVTTLRLLKEGRRRGMFGEDFDAEAEAEEARKEREQNLSLTMPEIYEDPDEGPEDPAEDE